MRELNTNEIASVGGSGFGDWLSGLQVAASAVGGFLTAEQNLAAFAGEEATLAALNGGNLGA